MSVKISGVMKDALGKPISNCIIRLTAIGTSAMVIVTTRGESSPDAAGSYSMDVEPGNYRVMLIPDGWPPEVVGTIEVRDFSMPGSLNDFLTRAKAADLNEAVLARFERLAAQVTADKRVTADSKTAAKTSEDNAAASATAAADSKTAAKTSEDNAAASATAAADSKTAADTSATSARASEQLAAQHAADAQGGAAGAGRLIAFKKIEVSGEYVPSPGAKRIIFEAVGAGGSSTTLNTVPAWIYSPGMDGTYVKFMDETVRSSYTITIGAPVAGRNKGGDTSIATQDWVIKAWGGGGSEGVVFNEPTVSEPKEIVVALSNIVQPGSTHLILSHTGGQLVTGCLIMLNDGRHITSMVMTAPAMPLGVKCVVRDISKAYFYIASTGYGVGSPGYWPGVTGVVDEAVMLGRPGVVFAWEYN